MNINMLEFNFADFEFVTLLQYVTKTFTWYLILQRQFVREIRKIKLMQNIRLLQYLLVSIIQRTQIRLIQDIIVKISFVNHKHDQRRKHPVIKVISIESLDIYIY